MINILQSLSKTVHLSLGIAILLLLGLHFFGDGFAFDRYFFSWLFRYLHVLTGTMWIDYFGTLILFRSINAKHSRWTKTCDWKSYSTQSFILVSMDCIRNNNNGINISYLQGYVHQAMIVGIGSGDPKTTAIGIGMWLGIIISYNVWFVIWPNQKKALGMVDCTPEEKLNQLKQQCFSQEQILYFRYRCYFQCSCSKSLLIKERYFPLFF